MHSENGCFRFTQRICCGCVGGGTYVLCLGDKVVSLIYICCSVDQTMLSSSGLHCSLLSCWNLEEPWLLFRVFGSFELLFLFHCVMPWYWRVIMALLYWILHSDFLSVSVLEIRCFSWPISMTSFQVLFCCNLFDSNPVARQREYLSSASFLPSFDSLWSSDSLSRVFSFCTFLGLLTDTPFRHAVGLQSCPTPYSLYIL